jgi:hypothetical protein
MGEFSDEKVSAITFKDVLILVDRIWTILYLKRLYIIIFTFLFGFLGYYIAFTDEANYDAEITFVIEDNETSSPLGGLGGIASQFGLDFGGSSNAFSQANIEELVKSRRLIEDALLTPAVVDNKEDKLINHFISLIKLDENWDDSIKYIANFPVEKDLFSFEQDSIMSIVYNKIASSFVNIDFKNETNIMYLKVNSENEDFSLRFVESLIKKLDKYYISFQTAKAQLNLNFISKRADSVLIELQSAELLYAEYKDSNFGVRKSKGVLQELRLQRDVQILNVMYSEIIKNLELTKFTSLNQKPLISIIDSPKFPLKQNLKSKSKYFVLFFILGFFISAFYFTMKQLIKDELD